MRRLRLPLALSLLLAVAACGAPTAGVPDDPLAVRPLLPGMSAPSFELKEADGSVFRYQPGAMEKPVVLAFYRGGWCPYCNTHMGELRKAEQALVALGYDVMFVSPDQPSTIAAMEADNEFEYRLMSDSPMSASRAFGLAFRVDDATIARYEKAGIDLAAQSGERHFQLPVPAVYVIGTDGVIRFAYVNPNYRVRLSPTVLVAAAEDALEQG